MPVMMMMDWAGVTREQYDEVCRLVNFEVDQPKGGLYHVASVDDKGLHVTDVWENAELFQSFVEKRLMPGVMKAGITTEPKVNVLPAIKIFAPGYAAK